MPAIDAVVFDIGNVLLRWDPEGFYDRAIGRGARLQLFAEVDLEAMNAEVDKGAPLRDSVYALAKENPKWASQILLWHDRWIEMLPASVPLSVQTLRALRHRGIPVFALSNFGRETFDVAQRHHDFLAEFDRLYISGRMGVIKPDPEIYRRLEDDSGIDPQRLLFADDRADNIETARSRGWQTHHFTDPEGWSRRLIDEHLIMSGDLKP